MAGVAVGISLSYFANLHFEEQAIEQTLADIDAKMKRGEALEPSEQMYDGTGDRVAALYLGWMPAAVSVCVGLPIRNLIHRWLLRSR